MVPRIDMDQIGTLIDEAPYLSDLQRAFYKRYIRARYDLILTPALDLAISLEQEQDTPTMGM